MKLGCDIERTSESVGKNTQNDQNAINCPDNKSLIVSNKFISFFSIKQWSVTV